MGIPVRLPSTRSAFGGLASGEIVNGFASGEVQPRVARINVVTRKAVFFSGGRETALSSGIVDKDLMNLSLVVDSDSCVGCGARYSAREERGRSANEDVSSDGAVLIVLSNRVHL
jgi:hypothetical protein